MVLRTHDLLLGKPRHVKGTVGNGVVTNRNSKELNQRSKGTVGNQREPNRTIDGLPVFDDATSLADLKRDVLTCQEVPDRHLGATGSSFK